MHDIEKKGEKEKKKGIYLRRLVAAGLLVLLQHYVCLKLVRTSSCHSLFTTVTLSLERKMAPKGTFKGPGDWVDCRTLGA